MGEYTPHMDPERVARLRTWHDNTSAALHGHAGQDVTHLGVTVWVPAGVFPPQPMSELLGAAVCGEVVTGDDVCDMGTGCGVNAILAARGGGQVTAVDVNATAVRAAELNAQRCEVADSIEFRVGHLFDDVPETFDVIIFDPPFRWFTPVDMLDRAYTDAGYRTLTEFFDLAGDRLNPKGRVLMLFGTTGDISYFHKLAKLAGFDVEVLDEASLERDGEVETYWAFRLTAR